MSGQRQMQLATDPGKRIQGLATRCKACTSCKHIIKEEVASQIMPLKAAACCSLKD